MADGKLDFEHNNKMRIRQYNNNVIVPKQLLIIINIEPFMHVNIGIILNVKKHPVHSAPPQILPSNLPNNM